MSKWIAEFELEDGDTMPEHMDLNYKGVKIDFHCKPLEQEPFINKPCVSSGVCEHDKNKALDKIRADINTMPCAITSMKEVYVNRDKVINILDKYKAEVR